MPSVEIVCEAGQTHGGRVDLALALVDAAAEAGAACIKFQHVGPELVVQRNAPIYWDGTAANQREAFAANGSLSHGEWVRVFAHAERAGIEAFSTPFDEVAVAQLVDLGVKRFKISSGDLTHRGLIEAVAATGLPVILSTGAADIIEVDRAMAWWRKAGGVEPITLLACSLIYPCPVEHAHLDRITELRKLFGEWARIGYSDHTTKPAASMAAVALGAVMLEKHFCLGPSHVPDTTFALTPSAMDLYVSFARQAEKMIARCDGDCEAAARQGARRSLCAARDLPEGHQLAASDVVALRPAGGIEPSADVVGAFVTRAYREGEAFDPKTLSGPRW